jgi:transcription initiation factor IIE alpha subunit
MITRLLDGEGLETNSGVHGKRGYYGKYMFTWLGAAVDIPSSVYKFLSTIGFKIYFLRLPRCEATVDDLFDQLTSKKNFGEKMDEIEKLMMDYLIWFEICPIAIGSSRTTKIEWNHDKDDKEIIRIIARLALLLSHLRGHVIVYESSEHPDFLPVENNNYSHHNSGYSHRLPIIENPSRAAQQLFNLARGHALSYGRNFITRDDVLLVIKVVLSTSLIERVLVLDLLIAHKGTLTTSQITESLGISNNTAKRTMVEFKGLKLVDMERIGDASNSEYRITLNPKFNWFLEDEFKKLREEFKPIDYHEELKERKSAVRKNTPVQVEEELPKQQKEDQQQEKSSSKSTISETNTDIHKGKNGDSKNNTEKVANNNIQGDNSNTNSKIILSS